MASFLGESVGVKADPRDPFTGAKLTAAGGYEAYVDFFAPGKAPKTVPADRVAPDVANVAMTYNATIVNEKDSSVGAWVLYQPTEGAPWVAGKWWFRVTVTSSSYDNWEYSSFVLRV